MSTHLANMDRVGARVVWLLGARNDAYEFAVADDRFDKYEIANAIIETEAEIVKTMADAGHSHLEKLRSWVALDHAEPMPKHLGKVIAVRASSACSDDQMMEPTTRENIRLWKENYENIFSDQACGGDLAGYYNLTNDVITFTGDFAEALMVIYNPTYPDRTAQTYGTLQIDSVWEPALVNGAIGRLAKLGVPPELVQHNQGLYENAKQSIMQGMTFLPEVDVEMRADNP